jgi:glycosyltransferase involved in cell wall biosynthesis
VQANSPPESISGAEPPTRQRAPKESSSPLISVIIPTYNRADFVADAIRSVQAQTYPRVEIIVADDGSTDHTPEIIAQFGGTVTYLRLPHRGQPAATRNAALSAARGEYVAFLDSDDLFTRDKLALQVSTLQANPSVGLVYSDGYYFRDDPSQPMGHLLDGLPRPSGDALAQLLRGNFIVSPAMVLTTRGSLDTAGLFDEDPGLFGVEDYDLWLRVSAHFPFLYIQGDVAAIRRHPRSISRDVAALRSGVLRVLEKLEQAEPHARRRYGDALNEGYARNHGAVAVALWNEREFPSAVRHAVHALLFSLRTSGLGTAALGEWMERRRVRGTGARP